MVGNRKINTSKFMMDFGDDESESDDNAGSLEESCSESEVEDDNDAVNEEEWTSSAEAKSDCSDDDAVDLEANAEAALKKLLPCSLEEFEKNLAKDEYESNFLSAVVAPGEIGVKFNDVGALEEVKKALNELVILPMRRPELFSHGNLLRWFGDAEKLTKALFSFASKLAPVIIFVDEVDSLLGARGGSFEHEATRRMRNEFMAAWDGLRSKDSQRILILGATNRPFDLDDAVIRRIHVDLPDAENRMKILRIILNRENLEPDFQFDKLANATEGYSGSDLKNLCIAAAYRPVEELLEQEKGGKNGAAPALRPLNLEDFIQSKAKVGPSVSFDAASMNELRKWNEQYGEGGNRKKSPFVIESSVGGYAKCKQLPRESTNLILVVRLDADENFTKALLGKW
ncbi:hypothetical protein SADUNF_Sadunf07G0058600 [Salix dunnii]|uniref:AAA+ ATPase domain-containing protein n=1 Tax=Salix dunnii TaxID=1413687 RepID=A0A835MVS8_9ROSI|nr:hypothetical protein SADUNF_Sadunf07G0058600 [Salix dunnii]